jgi:hypothetical protein
MKTFNTSLLALGLAAVFSATAMAGETSINGWGKAYAEAAARQKAGVSAGASGELTIKAVTPDAAPSRSGADRARTGGEAAMEKTRSTVEATAERARGTVENTADKVRGTVENTSDKVRNGVNGSRERVSSELADAARRMGESQPAVNARVDVAVAASAAVRAAERPAISLFQNPGALVERPVIAERPVLLERPVLVERPTIIRPERLASILR